MDINLTIYDMEKFLDKYTRFMTKDIYISNKMYSGFLEQYNYLYKILNKDRFLYNDNKKYKRVMDILKNRVALIRLHNQKYLQRALKKYDSFFKIIDKLDNRKKMIILSEEESTYVVGDKNYDSLVVGKLKYLIGCKNYSEGDILVLGNDKEKINVIRERCRRSNIGVKIGTVREYGERIVDLDKLLDDGKRYDILIDYIIGDLFSDKVKFNSFYGAFSKYIYLNKDYKDYDTFKDYHNYMYKRKFLASKLSLKKFNEKEIKKRQSYLRTINNETLKYKEEVDIANFLYLNNLEYRYDGDEDLFRVRLSFGEVIVKYFNEYGNLEEKNTYRDDTIYLYSSYDGEETYLSVLVYELIKRRCPLERVSDEGVYARLSSTNIDSYFSEFVIKYLIPLIRYYEENKDLSRVNISELGIKEFLNIYQVYAEYLEINNLVTERELLERQAREIEKEKYKYLFLIGDISIRVKIPTFTIVDDYQGMELIKENIKLLYDYKKYLYENQVIPIMHTYLDKREVNSLTNSFLKDNLAIINKSLEETNKDIEVYEYDDGNRLKVYSNITMCCSKVLEQQGSAGMLGFECLKDINILMGDNIFTKLDRNTLLTKEKVSIRVEEILKIDKLYDTIVLPYLIKDSYHEELFKDDYQYNVKVMLYVALNKCRNKLVILCPSSKVEELNKLLFSLRKE